ncbi:MAG: nUDIX hydrolase, partial [Gaeavirus sp.]
MNKSSSSSFNKSTSYGGIIKCSSTGRYLLVQGRSTGKWSFPKGHIEPNETPHDCAKREIYEETGLTINNIQNKKLIRLSSYSYYSITLNKEYPTKQIDTNEILDIKWFLPEETIELDKNKDVYTFFSRLLTVKNNTNVHPNIR